MSKITKSSWPLMVVGVVTLAVLLQGCLLREKLIADFYPAVIGIPDGVRQEVFRNTFSFPGSGYCNEMPGSISVNGFISQARPRPEWLYHEFTHLDELDNPIRSVGVNVMVNRDTGEIPDQNFPNVIDPGCFAAGHKLVVVIQPIGGNIDEGASVTHGIRWAF